MSHKRSITRHIKRQQFEHQQARSRGRWSDLALKGTVVVLALATLYFVFSGRKSTGTGTVGADLSIQLAEITSQAKFYKYTASGGQEIGFFVVKSSDGVIRAAFDACDVCYPAHKGYYQEGDDMVCRKCGRHFPSKDVNDVTGGCNPVALARAVEGDRLLIKASDLEGGARYF